MPEVSNELIYNVLQTMQKDVAIVKDGQKDIRNELQAMRGHLNATQADIANIYGKLAGLEIRVERIENRPDIVAEPAE